MSTFKTDLMTKADKWLIVILLVAAALGVVLSKTLFLGTGKKYVQISVNGEIVKTISLREGYREEFFVGDESFYEAKIKESNLARNAIKGYNIQGYNIVEITSLGARVKEADCPDQICVQTGLITAAPQQIVCLPNRLAVKIISDAGQVDDIAR
ncbi:MAG: NusG domain II-containing protein [Sporomusaceae bacterium]|jgi:hypothetical protein|nr:NusG domain II-containing protein [Sporomusaceae bacterium]